MIVECEIVFTPVTITSRNRDIFVSKGAVTLFRETCFVFLGDIVAGQLNARNISQCNIPCNG